VERFGSCVSLPAVLGHGGVLRTIDIPLSDEEEEGLLKSVEEIKKMVRTEETTWISESIGDY
jgi:malate/lactate dehydrogenase